MRTRMRLLAMAAGAGVVLSACGGGGSSTTDAGAVPSTAPTTAPAPPGTAGQPSTSPVPTADPAPPTTGPTRGAGRTLPFEADTGPETSSLQQGTPVLVGVRAGNHPGYTRYVFDFVNADPQGHSPLGSARPGWDVRYVPPAEAVQDGSGDPPPVGGAVYLRIRFDGAAAHYEDGTPSIRYGLDAHAPLGFGGDFEGRVTWFLGLEHQQPFRVLFVENNKVAVDVVDGR